MNIVMYGFEPDTVRDIAEEYGFVLCCRYEDFRRSENGMLLQCRVSSEAEGRELMRALEDFADDIDTVIAALPQESGDIIHYCPQPWKLFAIDVSDEEPEYEIGRIIESHLGLICAHEGI